MGAASSIDTNAGKAHAGNALLAFDIIVLSFLVTGDR